MGKFIDLTGQKFGMWTVIKRAENTKRGQPRWVCRCDCGNVATVQGCSLKSGKSRNCGCVRKEKFNNAKHKQSYTRLYHIWTAMKERCFNENNNAYKHYGGRGITVCDEWLNDFQAFYNWAMANGYKDDLTIDRIDSNGNYEPSNCRWVTQKEQCNNTRRNVVIEFNGKEQTLQQWADEMNISCKTLWGRLNCYHWSVEKALTTPVNVKK